MGEYTNVFTNCYGETWEFQYDYARAKPLITGSDVDWNRYPAYDGEALTLILDEEEQAWLSNSWDEATRTVGSMSVYLDCETQFAEEKKSCSLTNDYCPICLCKKTEFENHHYFVSPEWKYYERLKSDPTSQQIYATGQIIFDTNSVFRKIQKAAISIFENYDLELDIRERTDYSFYVETIMKDGIDVLTASELENFYFLSGMHIPKLCNIVAKVKKHYPVYEKYAMEHLKLVDDKLYAMVMEFYRAEDKDGLGSRWTDLCKYVLSELGNIDIKDYQVVTDLKRE